MQITGFHSVNLQQAGPRRILCRIHLTAEQ